MLQGLPLIGMDRPCERHVKTEIVHHIRITPAVELRDLALSERALQTALSIMGGERGAEAIKIFNGLGCQRLQISTLGLWYQGDK